jgi:protocatechuate 3,4-dioxygenase beta subunit
MSALTLALLLVFLQTATPAASISGRVIGADGRPIPNAAVDALERVPGSDELYLVQRVQTNERGEYRLSTGCFGWSLGPTTSVRSTRMGR